MLLVYFHWYCFDKIFLSAKYPHMVNSLYYWGCLPIIPLWRETPDSWREEMLSGVWCAHSASRTSATSFYHFAVVKCSGIARTWQQWIKTLHKPICERRGEGISPGNIEQPSPHLYSFCQKLLLVITSGMSSCCFSSNLFAIHHKWSSTLCPCNDIV